MTHHEFGARTLGAALLVMALTGCLAGLPSQPPIQPQPVFDPTRFFAGRTHGEGVLDVRLGADRTLRVEGVGLTEADGTFRLTQTITDQDSAVETRVWRLRRVDATHYTGTLSDAKGAMHAETEGNRLHLRYLLRQPAVYMEQWLSLQPGGRSALNVAQVTILGVPWARLTETIVRMDDTPTGSP